MSDNDELNSRFMAHLKIHSVASKISIYDYFNALDEFIQLDELILLKNKQMSRLMIKLFVAALNEFEILDEKKLLV